MHILVVDDEIELANALQAVLSREGYQTTVAYDGQQGQTLALAGNYDLVILDWLLPHTTGLEICQNLRSHDNPAPVLFLTAKDTLDDRVLGLDAGADDYLVKPFELRELLARVRALLRRSNSAEAPSPRLKIADLELDQENQLAYRQNRPIELSDKETQLLAYFMANPGQLLAHDQIHQHLWPEANKPNSNVLAALIRLLRRKIEAPGEMPLIHTVYGKGYRFGQLRP